MAWKKKYTETEITVSFTWRLAWNWALSKSFHTRKLGGFAVNQKLVVHLPKTCLQGRWSGWRISTWASQVPSFSSSVDLLQWLWHPWRAVAERLSSGECEAVPQTVALTWNVSEESWGKMLVSGWKQESWDGELEGLRWPLVGDQMDSMGCTTTWSLLEELWFAPDQTARAKDATSSPGNPAEDGEGAHPAHWTERAKHHKQRDINQERLRIPNL